MKAKTAKGRSWMKFLAKLTLLALFSVAVAMPLFTVREFSKHAEQFNFYLEMGDSVGTFRELEQMRYFYELSRKWKVQWLADRYLFRDAYHYEVADIYQTRDWEKVKAALKDRLDDPRSFPYGNAKFREAQIRYQAGSEEEALKMALEDVRADYERDLRNCLRAAAEYLECVDRVWNYDLASDPDAAKDALGQPTTIPSKYILGPLKGNEDEEKLSGRPPGPIPPLGSKKLDEEEKGGPGQRKRP